MPAYVVSEFEILDEVLGEQYRDLAAASIASFGGRYLVRAADPEVPEEDWPGSRRMVVVEFPTMERLHEWYRSPEYAEALAVRRTALNRRLLFVDGLRDPDRVDVAEGVRTANAGIVRSEFHEEEVESRWEAAPAILLAITLQLLLAIVSEQKHWKLWGLPWWVWLLSVVPELALLVPLAFQWPRQRLEQLGQRRTAAIGLIAIVSVANGLALVALVGSLLSGDEKSGAELLFKGATIWGTNVIVFSLWFWGLDRGGPFLRRESNPPPPDFQFPQLENPQLAERDWHPRLLDYMYLSFTNSIAFSPTDVMPLTRWAKLLMMAESGLSAATILLVAARSVNIFK